MKLVAVAAVLACSLPAVAQSTQQDDSRTGVSTPPPMAAENPQPAPDNTYPDGYRPTPAQTVPTPTSSFGRHQLTPGATPQAAEPTSAQEEPAVAFVAAGPADNRGYRDDNPHPVSSKSDIDAGIVTEVPSAPNEFPAGTMFKVRMRQTLSTSETEPGTPFSAELIEPIQKEGRTLVPSGSTLEGRVTEVHGGHRIRGAAALHLEPRTLTLPDGSRYDIHAQVIDTGESFATRIDSEGTIYRRDHIKTTLAVLGAATGTSAVAGALIGGGVGAAVGAGIGAGIATAWWLKQDRQTVLPKDTAVVFTLNEPIAIGIGTLNR